MKPFRLLVDYNVFQFIQTLRRFEQLEIHEHFDQSNEFPHHQKSLIEKDATGRDYFVSLRGTFAVKYWIDEWECEVKVIAIRLRDHRK